MEIKEGKDQTKLSSGMQLDLWRNIRQAIRLAYIIQLIKSCDLIV